MINTFWINDPTVLMSSEHITELWIYGDYDYERKLNAITRIVIALTVLGYIASKSVMIIGIGVVTIIAIVILYKMKKKGEGFEGNGSFTREMLASELDFSKGKNGYSGNEYKYPKDANKVEAPPSIEFTKPTKSNPMMNVLLPDIKYNPDKKAAAPAFNPDIEKEINRSVGVDPRLFLDLGDSINFDKSMQRFYTTANSRVSNDQDAFAKYCYGDMPSCKDGDTIQCVKNNKRYINR